MHIQPGYLVVSPPRPRLRLLLSAPAAAGIAAVLGLVERSFLSDDPPIAPPTGKLKTDSTIPEGGTVVVQVDSAAVELEVHLPGGVVHHIPVVNGRAEFEVPPGVRGGDFITFCDNQLPSPSSAIVEVISTQRS